MKIASQAHSSAIPLEPGTTYQCHHHGQTNRQAMVLTHADKSWAECDRSEAAVQLRITGTGANSPVAKSMRHSQVELFPLKIPRHAKNNEEHNYAQQIESKHMELQQENNQKDNGGGKARSWSYLL